MTLVKDNLGEL